MVDSVSTALAPWSSFYIMTGSSAAALTGLMFVVITLVRRAGADGSGASQDGVSAFSTPTVLHFCVALLVSAILVAPWHVLVVPSVLIGLAGLLLESHVVQEGAFSPRLFYTAPGGFCYADSTDWPTGSLVASATLLCSSR